MKLPQSPRTTVFSGVNPQLLALVAAFWQWRTLWLGCTIIFSALGLCYALLVKSDMWVASQGLMIRDEATGTVMRLGRFESQTQMKAAQETILELTQNSTVVQQALNQVGRPPRLLGLMPDEGAYSLAEAESFARSYVKVRAPRGAELGTTEVIYLEVKQGSKERAVLIASALADSLEQTLRGVRQARAQGVIAELEAALAVAEVELARSTGKLQQIELDAGADLADLRGLTDANSGSTNRLMLDLVRDDLRKCEMELQTQSDNLEATRAALNSHQPLLHVTDRLVDSQPAIKRLREGLAEATIRSSQLQGVYADAHPEVINALSTEEQFRIHLRRELSTAAATLQESIRLTERRMAKLHEQEQQLGLRLNRLADIRAQYTNVVAEVRAQSDEVHQIKRELTQAMSARDAAAASSLITRLNEPQVGERPVGPGRGTIVGGAMVGGLFFGLGIVFLMVPLDASPMGPLHSASSRAGCPATMRMHEAEELSRAELQSVSRANPRGPNPFDAASTATAVPQAPIATPIPRAAAEDNAQPTEKNSASSPTMTSSQPATAASSAVRSVATAQATRPPLGGIDEVQAIIANALKQPSDRTKC